jgi:hypothetical protein
MPLCCHGRSLCMGENMDAAGFVVQGARVLSVLVETPENAPARDRPA